jgi:hypothetical protein
MACGRSIKNHDIMLAGIGELFHLAEHYEVVNSRGSGANNFDHARLRKPASEVPKTLVKQVILERRTRRNRPNIDPIRTQTMK